MQVVAAPGPSGSGGVEVTGAEASSSAGDSGGAGGGDDPNKYPWRERALAELL